MTKKITEELFQAIDEEMRKISNWDQIPSIDWIIRIIDISSGTNLKKKLPFFYTYKKWDDKFNSRTVYDSVVDQTKKPTG